MNLPVSFSSDYQQAMGRLLVLYTQIDRLIMEICAQRLPEAPNEEAQLALAKQVGDESRHVSIQRAWMRDFGADPTPLITPEQEQLIREHFQSLPWMDFLVDLYLCVEALGSEAVERIVPLVDLGTRESLRIPLTDELDHVDFGLRQIKKELARMSAMERQVFINQLPVRIESLTKAFHGFGIPERQMFEAVGADYDRLCFLLEQRQKELIADLIDASQCFSKTTSSVSTAMA